MEIQLFKALTAAGIDQETAANLTEAMERDIREKIKEARTDLASKSDVETLRRELAEAKTNILKWNIVAIVAAIAMAMTATKVLTP